MSTTKRVRRAVLHIGTEKTGTTSIQRSLAENRQALATQGVYVPFSGTISDGDASHVGFTAAALREGPAAEGLLGLLHTRPRLCGKAYADDLIARVGDELRSLDRAPEMLLLSNEHVHSRLFEASEVSALHGILAALAEEIHVLLYIRPQHDIAQSFITTSLLNGHVASPPWIDAAWGRPLYGLEPTRVTVDPLHPTTAAYFDYERIAGLWTEVCGRASVTIRRYVPTVVVDYLDTVGSLLGRALDLRGFRSTDQRLNVRLPLAAQRMLFALNLALWGEPISTVRRARDVLTSDLGFLPSGAGLLPTGEEARLFQQRWASGNDRLREEYFPSLEELFDLDYSGYPDRPMILTPDFSPRVAAAVVAGRES